MSPFDVLMEGIAAVVAIVVVLNILYYGVAITLYVLGSMGLYTIAKRRELQHPWMAWVPVLSYWTLGSVSDQYQYVVKGKIRNRRKWMIGLVIAMVVLMIAMYVAMFTSYFQALFEIMLNPELEYMDESQVLQRVLLPMVPGLVIAVVCLAVSIVLTVLQYICYYHLFASCNPEYKVLYLVLSIVFGFLLPVFTFVCRKKDLGMPPRRDAFIPQPMFTDPQQAEPWTQPEQPEPWTQSEE